MNNIGIDIIEIKRIKLLVNNEKFMKRIFTDNEIKYFTARKNNPSTIAGFFCAKEAVSKCLGTGISGFSWKDIEIFADKTTGKPSVTLHRNAIEKAIIKGIEVIEISISHSKDTAICIAAADGNNFNIEKPPFFLKKRALDSHKGDFGRIGIIGGSRGMAGALYLSCNASLKTGSGLVYALVPKSLECIYGSRFIEVIAKYFDDNDKGYLGKENIKIILEEVSKIDILCIGPGLGKCQERSELVNEIIRKVDKPIILDADGLNCISDNVEILKEIKKTSVVTPHAGEMSRLIKKDVEWINNNKEECAKEFSMKYNIVTVLKGRNTVVAFPDGNTYVNKTGNPGMATAGSGDVLTGIIASLAGQGYDISQSAVVGTYLHGLAGDIAAHKKGEYGIIASDILEALPYAIKIISSN